KCLRCGNYKHTLFCTYTDYYGEVTYCLRCVNLGRSDSRTPLRVIEPSRYRELIEYKLSFQLNNEQQYAQERIVQAIKHRHDLIIYAVTGAGKTERSEEHTSELQSRFDLVCRLLLEKKKQTDIIA